jgi:hypothetical protein
MFQPENALPIPTWIDDQNDKELSKLETVLELLSNVYDVRPYIKKLVVNDSINHKKAEALLKCELEIPLAKLQEKADSPPKKQIFIATRNSVDTKQQTEKLCGSLYSPKSVVNAILKHNSYRQPSQCPNSWKKPIIFNSLMKTPYEQNAKVAVPSTALSPNRDHQGLLTIGNKSNWRNSSKDSNKNVQIRGLTPGQKQGHSLTANFSNLLKIKKEKDHGGSIYSVDKDKWVEYCDSIRKELDKCFHVLGGKNLKTKQVKIQKGTAVNKKKVTKYLEGLEQWSLHKGKPTSNRNAERPLYSHTHMA